MRMDEFPAATDGPNRLTGGPDCRKIHAGITADVPDCFCCCNPCLHATAPGRIGPRCCRCVPAMICVTFTLNSGQSECCKGFSVFALAEFSASNVSYTVTIDLSTPQDDETITLLVEEVDSTYPGGPCQWRLSSTLLYDDVTYPIDHSVGDCMNLPSIEIENVTVNGCVGTITASIYEPVKLPFENKYPTAVVPKPITGGLNGYAPCHCEFAADRLCVGGVRHAEGDVEYVVFVWNEATGDRWDYWPCGMTEVEANLAYLHEVIYIRGDSYGNCYLELDFEQTGMDTNDWADPPNSYDNGNPYDIRDGMVAIDLCDCGMVAETTSTGGRSIRIHAGECSRYRYKCATCRCIPESLCYVAGITTSGVTTMSSGSVSWDGDAWVGGGWSIGIGESESCGCAVTASNAASVLPFGPSADLAKCGNFLYFNSATEFDEDHPQDHGFFWGTGSLCGCGSTPRCGPCPTRCGGPPETLYLTIVEGIRDSYPYDMIDLGPFECTYSIEMKFYNLGGLVPICGYIGEVYTTCKGVTTRNVATMTSPGWLVTVNKYSTVNGLFASGYTYPYDLSNPDDCEPFEFYAENNPSGEGAYYTFHIIE